MIPARSQIRVTTGHSQRGGGGVHFVVGAGRCNGDVEKPVPCVGCIEKVGKATFLRVRVAFQHAVIGVGICHTYDIAASRLRFQRHFIRLFHRYGAGSKLYPFTCSFPCHSAVCAYPQRLHTVKLFVR